MSDDSPSSGDKFTLRFPPGLRKQLRVAAKANGRSMNNEIIAHVQAGLDGGGGGAVDVGVLAQRIVEALVGRLVAASPVAKPPRRRGRQPK